VALQDDCGALWECRHHPRMGFDFSTLKSPFRMQPGLRPVAPGARQLHATAPGSRALREKLDVLRSHPTQALCVSPGFDPGPALCALAAHAQSEYPTAFAGDGITRCNALRLGWHWVDGRLDGDGATDIGECLRALPAEWQPSALLALCFVEDFAIVDGRSGVIPWMAVCLPSHWAPEDKIGQSFAQVHGPVADNQNLLAASAHLIRLVTSGQRWERDVWTLGTDAHLDQHPHRRVASPWAAAADPLTLAMDAVFRTERQTFIPVPGQDQAVFCIQVESEPLVRAIRSPHDAQRLHDALASMSAAVLRYRRLEPARDRLLAWLAARANE
jgi:hypothetical protein